MIRWVASIKNIYNILTEELHAGGGKSWRNTVWKCRLDSIHPGYSQMVDLGGHVNEPSGSIKAGHF
jgi:hypothetical protein